MSSNERLLAAAYGEGDREEQRLLHSRAWEMDFQYTVRLAQRYMDPTKSVVEIGCATGRYGMYFADQCQAYLGVDLLPAHVERFARKIREKGLKNVRAMVGDATRLDGVADESCDVVLALGPMYHLPRAERKLVFQECRRICRQGGVLLFSFANQAGAYFNGCLRLSNAGYYPNKAVNEIVLKRGESDQNPGLFYLTMPEEMEQAAAECGLRVLYSAGVDFAFGDDRLEEMPQEQYGAWRELCDFCFAHPSCAGVCDHAVLVCQKT